MSGNPGLTSPKQSFFYTRHPYSNIIIDEPVNVNGDDPLEVKQYAKTVPNKTTIAFRASETYFKAPANGPLTSLSF